MTSRLGLTEQNSVDREESSAIDGQTTTSSRSVAGSWLLSTAPGPFAGEAFALCGQVMVDNMKGLTGFLEIEADLPPSAKSTLRSREVMQAIDEAVRPKVGLTKKDKRSTRVAG